MRLVQISLVAALLATAGCSPDNLMVLRNDGDGPDEFLIAPGLPLQEPESYTELPAPTPFGENRADQTPLQDSVAALGGNRPAATGNIPGSDGAVVNHASRFGRDGGIRASLAAEDEEYRKRRGRLLQFRLLRRENYALAYKPQTLDAFAEHRRWRAAGAATPSAPQE